MRILCAYALALALILLLGCEGDTRHDIVTGEDGSLLGMTIYPSPQSLNVDTSDDFYLEWAPGYYPPDEFTFTLQQVHRDGTTQYLSTVLTELSVRRYRFEPIAMPSETFLLLTVHGAGETVKAMYLTDSGINLAPSRTVPEGAKTEHVVRPKR